MKAIKKLLGGIGFLLIAIYSLIISYSASGIWAHLSLISLLTLAIGIYLTISGIFTKD